MQWKYHVHGRYSEVVDAAGLVVESSAGHDDPVAGIHDESVVLVAAADFKEQRRYAASFDLDDER